MDIINKFINPQHSFNADNYLSMYNQSINDPQNFWAEQAERYITWFDKWDSVLTGDFDQHNIQWFRGAHVNACYNCLDRHLPHKANDTAIIWEGDEPDQSIKLSYQQLFEQVCAFANVLKAHGIAKGDRVCIYMPMIPEAAIAMLACSRIGAIHSVVFGGFSAQALQSRVEDAQCKAVITADGGIRGGKQTALKTNVDTAVAQCDYVKHVFVVQYTQQDIPWQQGRDVWYHQAMSEASTQCDAEPMEANDPLFILYTSGSTGKPKGIVHASGGYLLYATMTFQRVFDYQAGDVYWCSADVGWVTGHSYVVYGPLASGATSLMFAGVPTYPDHSRFWQVIDKHQVNIFYTAPTAIRALMREGDEFVHSSSRQSLKRLGTVGEPINPEAWQWYFNVVGEGRCAIVDTWWQTETGGIMISPLPEAMAVKPGSACKPFFGIDAAIVNEQGEACEPNDMGTLVINKPWPGICRSIYGDHQRYIDTYFSDFPGKYCPCDGAMVDDDGDFWITGRIDDLINVSGHLLGTAEIESALVAHPKVAEAAVVDFPHDIKGQGIYAFIVPMAGCQGDDALQQELLDWVKQQVGPIAKPDVLHWADDLPKTRSGKIMRRILRKLVHGEKHELGDTSTLANPQIVEILKSQV